MSEAAQRCAMRSKRPRRPRRRRASATMRPRCRGPMRLVAEFLAPGPQPPRRVVQRMLVGEPHRAVHLMRDRGAGAGGLADRAPWRSRPRPRSSRCRRHAARSPRRRRRRRLRPPRPRRPAARDCAAPPGTSRSAGRTGRGPTTIGPTGRECVRARRPSAAPAPRRRTARCRPCRCRRPERTAAALAPSNETVSRGSPARLAAWLIATASAGTSATDAVAVMPSEHDDMPGIAGERHLPGAAAQCPAGQLDIRRRRGSARSSAARRAPRSRLA